MTEIIKQSMNWSVVLQSLIIAAIVSVSTGYVNAKILENKVEYLAEALARNDSVDRETRLKLDNVALRQAAKVEQADTIHDHMNRRTEQLDKRIDRIEQRR